MDVRNLGLSDEDLEALGYRVSRKEEAPLTESGPQARGRTVRRDRGGRAWLWAVAVLVGVGWLARSDGRMPAPVPANQPDTVFSSARAMSQLVEIARAPRPTGSPEHERVGTYIADRLRDLGLDVEVQEATAAVADSGHATAASLRNVVAHLPGTASTGTVALTAHYDGPPLSWAAGDDGVGIASILETVRALRRSEPLRNDVLVVVTDGEELGSLGARLFLEREGDASEPAIALGLDAKGVSGAAVFVEGEEANGALVRIMDRTTRRVAANATARAFGSSLADDTDLAVFRDRGTPTLGLVSFGDRSAHGWPMDRPVNVHESTLQHHGAQLLALTRTLGDADLAAGTTLTGAPRAYFTLPFVGMVHYPASWSTLATFVLGAGFLLLAALFRLRGGRPKRALAGLALAAAVVGASYLGGRALLAVLAGLHPEYGRVDGVVFEDGLHLVALVALVLAVATGLWAVARRWLDRRELLLGALLVPLGCLVWLSVTAPFALVTMQIPFALALLAAIPLMLVPPTRTPVRWISAGVLVLSAGALLWVVPGVETLIALRTLEGAPELGAAMGVGALLLTPVFDRLARPRAWWTPTLAAAVAVVATTLALPASRGNARHPTPTSLVHLVDDTMIVPVADVGPAGDDRAPAAAQGSTIRWMPGRWLTVPGVGEGWTQSWVVGGTGGGSDPGPLLLPAADRWRVAGTGAEAQIPRPVVRVVEHAMEGAARRLRITVRPGLDAELVGVRVADGVAAELTAVNGHAWGASGPVPVRTLEHWGRSEGGAVTVDLRIDAGATTLAFDLIEHHLRPAEVLGPSFFQREDSVVADASTGSDRVIQRTRVEVPLPDPSPATRQPTAASAGGP